MNKVTFSIAKTTSVAFLSLVLVALPTLPQEIYASNDQIDSLEVSKNLSYSNLDTKILEVSLSVDKNSSKEIEITNARRLNGHLPKTKAKSTNYKLELFKDNTKLSSYSFELPEEVHGIIPEYGSDTEDNSHSHLELIDFDTRVSTKWHPGTNLIKIVAPNGEIIDSYNIGSLPLQEKILTFETYTQTNDNEVYNPADKLDIAFIGEDFGLSQQALFQSNVIEYTEYLSTIEPFHSRFDQFAFHTVENTTDLSCVYVGRLLTCNQSKAYEIVNNAGVPYDKIVIIVNNSEYGGSATSGNTCCAVTYNGTSGKQIFVHELAHLIGNLTDEYNLYDYLNFTNQVYRSCYAGIPPASEWDGLVGKEDYTQGCFASNWYRASRFSMMYALSYEYFNAPSQLMLNNQIDFFAGTFVDNQKPTVGITSHVSGQSVDGIQLIDAIASDDKGVARVTYWINGELIYTNYQEPYRYQWSTSTLESGAYEVQVKAYDVKGNVDSSVVMLNVNGTVVSDPPETSNQGPSITINAPTNGTTIERRGKTTVNISVNDPNGIKNTIVYVNNRKVKACRASTECVFTVRNGKFRIGSENILKVKSIDKLKNVSFEEIVVYRS